MTKSSSSGPMSGATNGSDCGRLRSWANPGKAAEDYASSLITAQLEGNGDEAVFRKVRADFDAAGIAQSDHQIRREMVALLTKAMREIVTGTAKPN